MNLHCVLFCFWKLIRFFLQVFVRLKDIKTQRSKILCFARDHCFFHQASSKANSPSSLCPPKTKASTQNLQTHPPLPGAFLGRHLALTTGSLRPKSGRYIDPATSIHPILNLFKLLALFLLGLCPVCLQKQIVIPFCKRELHV